MTKTLINYAAISVVGSVFSACNFNTSVLSADVKTNPAISETVPEKPGLKYFGYYHVEGFPFGSPDYIEAIGALSNSNVTIISPWHEKKAMHRLLNRCRKNRIKVFVSAFSVFFVWNPDGGQPVSMTENWEGKWQELCQKLRGYENDVIGFYFDEPFWNRVKEADFRFVTKKIREQFPEKRVLAVAAFTALNPSSKFNTRGIPEISETYFDFVTDCGFDIYDTWDKADYPGLLKKLKSKLNKNQNVWLIPWAFTCKNRGGSTKILVGNLKKMHEMALNEPRCLGLLCFSFASGTEGGDWGNGCHNLFNPKHQLFAPQLKKAHIQIGRSIVNSENTCKPQK